MTEPLDDLPLEDERLYDPAPCSGCEPWPPQHYAGTGIGALYGLTPMSADQAAALAGWSLPRPASREHQLEGWDYEPGSDPA